MCRAELYQAAEAPEAPEAAEAEERLWVQRVDDRLIETDDDDDTISV
jgi:hypothetical protein